jgi:hypothetical protein
MAAAALAVEALFAALHLIPAHHPIALMTESVRWNYTTILNLFFLLISAALLLRFLRTGGPAMLREMSNAPASPDAAPHDCCVPEPAPAPIPVTAATCCHTPEPEPASAPTHHCH